MHSFSINVTANLLARIWSMASNYVFVPFYISILGETSYGLISFFALLQALLGFLRLGLSNTLRREFAVGRVGRKNSLRKYKLLRSVESIYFLIGLLIIFICYYGVDYISTNWLNVENLDPVVVSTALLLMGVSIAFQFNIHLYEGCLFGLERQVQANIVRVGWSFFKNVGAILTISYLSPSIVLFYKWHIFVDFLYLILVRLMTMHYLKTDKTFTWSVYDFSILSSIWKYAMGIIFISFIALINRQLDKVIISKFLTLTELGAYNVALMLGSVVSFFPGAVSIAVFPRFTKAITTNDNTTATSDFLLINKLTNMVISSMTAYVGVFSPFLIQVWTGSRIYSDLLGYTGFLVVSATGLIEMQVIPYSLALAHGNTKVNSLVGSIFIPIVAVTMYFGVQNYGLSGAGTVFLAMMAMQTFLYEFLIYKYYITSKTTYAFLIILKDSLAPLLFSTVTAFFAFFIINSFSVSVFFKCFFAVICGGISLLITVFLFTKRDLNRIKLLYFNH